MTVGIETNYKPTPGGQVRSCEEDAVIGRAGDGDRLIARSRAREAGKAAVAERGVECSRGRVARERRVGPFDARHNDVAIRLNEDSSQRRARPPTQSYGSAGETGIRGTLRTTALDDDVALHAVRDEHASVG